MSRYVCDHIDECSYHKCIGRDYDSTIIKPHLNFTNGFVFITNDKNCPFPCSKNKVYFIPYFEYLIKKTLKEVK